MNYKLFLNYYQSFKVIDKVILKKILEFHFKNSLIHIKKVIILIIFINFIKINLINDSNKIFFKKNVESKHKKYKLYHYLEK